MVAEPRIQFVRGSGSVPMKPLITASAKQRRVILHGGEAGCDTTREKPLIPVVACANYHIRRIDLYNAKLQQLIARHVPQASNQAPVQLGIFRIQADCSAPQGSGALSPLWAQMRMVVVDGRLRLCDKLVVEPRCRGKRFVERVLAHYTNKRRQSWTVHGIKVRTARSVERWSKEPVVKLPWIPARSRGFSR